jgi:DHA1 family multidrug resistance protein-like MFS transporter
MAFVVFCGWSSMWPIMVYYVQTIGVPLTHVASYAAYVMLATGTAQTFSAPWFGKLGDRIGQKRVLVGATLAAGFFIIPHALVQTYAQFFGLRVLATACGAGVNPSTGALVARNMPPSRYAGAYGVLASARSLAASIGPLIGSQLAAFGNIRWVFLWTGVLTMGAGLWAQWAVWEHEPEKVEGAPGEGKR